MRFTPPVVTLNENGARPRTWLMHHSLTYVRPRGLGRSEDRPFTVPGSDDEPFETDLASVPRFLTWMVPTYGRYTKAVILHDHLVADRTQTESRFEADEVLRDAMKSLGVPLLQRWLMWAAVSWATIAGIIWAHLKNGRQVLVAVLGAAAGVIAVELVWRPWSADWTDWWRWLLSIVAVAASLILIAVLMDEKARLLGNAKLYVLLALTLFGVPFLAIGLLALLGILLYGIADALISPEYGRRALASLRPARAPVRAECAEERALEGRRVL